MKKKVTLKNTLSDISKIGRMMPRSINESMDFNGLDDMDETEAPEEAPAEEMPQEEPAEAPVEDAAPAEAEQPAQAEGPTSANPGAQQAPEEMRKKVASFVDNIRKKSLLGMAELADYPNSVEYEQMKKLWQMCDKKPEQKQGNTL